MSDLEKRVQVLESYLQADSAFLPYGQLEKCITDLEERLSSLASCQAAALDRVFTEAKRVTDLEGNRDVLSTAVSELQRVTSEFIRMQAQKVPELETKIETLWTWGNDTGAATFAHQSGRIRELEGKVESLTRTLDLLQEVIGIEVVVSVTGDAEHV